MNDYGHWDLLVNDFDPGMYFGFIYFIFDKINNMKYIGKRNFRVKSRAKHSWKSYTGSQKHLTAAISALGKDKLSDLAIADNRGSNLVDSIDGRKPRGPSMHLLTEEQKKSFTGIVWWTNGKEERKSKVSPDPTWKRGRLINKFDNNRESIWWTNGKEEIRTHELLSGEWIIGRKPKQLS